MGKQTWFSSNFSYVEEYHNENDILVKVYVLNEDITTIREIIKERQLVQRELTGQ